jgi:hypothetical protein
VRRPRKPPTAEQIVATHDERVIDARSRGWMLADAETLTAGFADDDSPMLTALERMKAVLRG